MLNAIKSRRRKLLAAVGIFLQCIIVPQSAGGTCIINEGSALERLYWLCCDYQLPVKGFVVEGWFAFSERKNTAQMLKKQFGICQDVEKQILSDGSQYSIYIQQNGERRYLELQLISHHAETAKQHELDWRHFARSHNIKQPVGVTILAELPEVLEEETMAELAGELMQSLDAKITSAGALEQGYQISGYTAQLAEYLVIEGQRVNVHLSLVRHENRTMLYMGAPVIYQQY